MSLIVQSGTKQFLVEYGQRIVVDRLRVPEGEIVDLELVWAFGADQEFRNKPTVQAKVLRHQRGRKIRVVKYKHKSNYRRQYGFRPEQTLLEIIK